MSYELIYRTLVPGAPLHRRTDGDEFHSSLFSLRAKLNSFLLENTVIPGLQKPTLVSSFAGTIDRILFCFPIFSDEKPDETIARENGYQSVIRALRTGTKFIVVHHESIKEKIETWFSASGHKTENVQFVSFPDYVRLTDWAEDAYVSVKDAADSSSYLMEPWEFKRSGDALIADAVEELSDIKASQAPLIFQGGNCLVGDEFWMLGKDYFVDTIEMLNGQRPPATPPEGVNTDDFAKELFIKYIDSKRKLLLIGTKKPIPLRAYMGTKLGTEFYLDIAAGGAGTFQPIFHIDMFITLTGLNAQGKFELLVGSPALAEKILETKSPFALNDVYDSIAKSLSDLGFSVKRNPLVHRPSLGETYIFSELKKMSMQAGYEALQGAINELSASGETDTSMVRIRDWHHITWNNCLVENSVSKGKHVYLPTFGYPPYDDLKAIDDEMKSMWEALGFTVHQLADFNLFARRQGVVHCIKKYLTRGE